MMSNLQAIALWPAIHIIDFILMLFGVTVHHFPREWIVLSQGLVALVFWAHLAKLILGVIQRRVFGYYGNGG